MTYLGRTNRPEAFRHWHGDVEADYIYTTGVAGERFFTELRDTGRLMAARCTACDLAYLPPRAYCETCLRPTTDWISVEGPATVEAVTIAYVDEHGARLPSPEVWAIVRWPGVHGGLVHRLAVPPERAKPGLKVRPVLRTPLDRVGNITDILHFAP